MQLKAAESFAATSKARIAALEHRLSELDSKSIQSELTDRSPNEWSGVAVAFWAEHVFGREHKTAQITEFVKELRSRLAGKAPDQVITGSVLLSLTRIAQFKALKLSDPNTMEAFDVSLEALRLRAAKASGADVLPP